ncbi:tyrosine recombinase XerC [Glaciimonas soli]|uniref:Tyrosine recombinase XerC n=1 Tax=Glaciimonas soli TaxID=2590999 RepID=A0A843YQM9_9BURK|nr:tyrosine-type recombinase/integrase [Glaciimonas soli]
MLSKHTTGNYARDLAELLTLSQSLWSNAPELPQKTQQNFSNLTHAHVRKFAMQLHSRGLSSRSIARKLSAWRGFFEWLTSQTPLASNPVDGVKAPKRAKPLPKALATDDAVRLVANANPSTGSNTTLTLCNHAMFELLYSSGLRVSELAALDVQFIKQSGYTSTGWVDLDAAEVQVTGKGNKVRIVPVGELAIAAIRDWLAVRANLLKNDIADEAKNAHALFLSERGTRVSSRVIQLRLNTHAQALGMPTHVHPHVLRHSFASHMLQGSGDLRAVQEMLGHSSITSTQIYTSLDFQRLAQVYDAAHPRAKKITEK